jgi:AmmeMemoRadiSam system protein B
MEQAENPKLRLVDAKPVSYEGASYLVLRDPLGLTDQTLLVPQQYVPVLALCDGARSPSTLRAALAIRYGIFLTKERIQEFLDALDKALLLENERSHRALAAARRSFRRAAFRPTASAGHSYPEDPAALAGYLQGFLDAAAAMPGNRSLDLDGKVRGLVSPHIDYERGGPVYAQVWGQAAGSARAADLAIIFGTDHYSEGLAFSLTRQNYATPFGVLPNDTTIVDRLAQAIGEEEAFAGELHHRQEHSIELAAVWMHHVRGGKPIATVPILAGSLEVIQQQRGGQTLEDVLRVLRQSLRGRRAIVIAAGDLSHVGPAIEGQPVHPGKLNQQKSADEARNQRGSTARSNRWKTRTTCAASPRST